MCLCGDIDTWVQDPADVGHVGSLETVDTSGYELLSLSAENQTQVLYKSRMCP